MPPGTSYFPLNTFSNFPFKHEQNSVLIKCSNEKNAILSVVLSTCVFWLAHAIKSNSYDLPKLPKFGFIFVEQKMRVVFLVRSCIHFKKCMYYLLFTIALHFYHTSRSLCCSVFLFLLLDFTRLSILGLQDLFWTKPKVRDESCQILFAFPLL